MERVNTRCVVDGRASYLVHSEGESLLWREERKETRKKLTSSKQSEEALLTNFKDWAKMPPARLGDLDFKLFSCPGQLNR